MESNKVLCEGGTGVTSCLSVRLHHVIKVMRENQGHYPEQIDSSGQFHAYRDEDDQNIADIILAPYKKERSWSPLAPGENALNYEHGWPAAGYDQMDVEKLALVA